MLGHSDGSHVCLVKSGPSVATMAVSIAIFSRSATAMADTAHHHGHHHGAGEGDDQEP